jgi:hypothetical protein
MKPSWSIFDCRQLISFRLPLTAASLCNPLASAVEFPRDGLTDYVR